MASDRKQKTSISLRWLKGLLPGSTVMFLKQLGSCKNLSWASHRCSSVSANTMFFTLALVTASFIFLQKKLKSPNFVEMWLSTVVYICHSPTKTCCSLITTRVCRIRPFQVFSHYQILIFFCHQSKIYPPLQVTIKTLLFYFFFFLRI